MAHDPSAKVSLRRWDSPGRPESGLTREGPCKALSPDGNPEFATVMKVIRALGLRLHGSAAHA